MLKLLKVLRHTKNIICNLLQITNRINIFLCIIELELPLIVKPNIILNNLFTRVLFFKEEGRLTEVFRSQVQSVHLMKERKKERKKETNKQISSSKTYLENQNENRIDKNVDATNIQIKRTEKQTDK